MRPEYPANYHNDVYSNLNHPQFAVADNMSPSARKYLYIEHQGIERAYQNAQLLDTNNHAEHKKVASSQRTQQTK
jgi:hypothetical protein